MARTASIAVALLAYIALAAAAGDPTEKLSGVHDLTPDTFNTVVTGAKVALVEFYAPWCGHCKHLVPEYKKLGELVQADPKLANRVVVAKVDADAHRSLGERFDVHGFPTIKFFPRGKAPSKETAQDYNSARTAEAFLSFLKQQLEEDKGFARVSSLDDLVKGFAASDDKAAAIKKVSEAVAGLTGDEQANGALYVKLMEKAAEKGAAYLGKELARLEKMLASGSVAASKVEEMSKKVSILGVLTGEAQ